MMNLIPNPYKYCPFCAKKLEIRTEDDKERKWCSQCQWTYYPHVKCAVGAVILKDSKVLLVRRNRDPYKGEWVFPAGFIDYGEHPEEALAREIKEETGLIIKESEFIGILQNSDDPRAIGHFGIFYKVTKIEGKVINYDTNENQDISWVMINKIPQLGWKSHRLIALRLGFKHH